MGLFGSLKATDDAIREDKSLKIPVSVNEPELDIKDVKNRFSSIEGSINQYVRTGISSDTYLQ